MDGNFACVILAAGRSVRFKSRTSKLLHELCGKPMLEWVLDSVLPLQPAQIILVHGQHNAELAELYGGSYKGAPVSCVVQDPPKGTADALLKVYSAVAAGVERLLVLPGDVPLITSAQLSALCTNGQASRFTHAVLTAIAPEPQGYGRVLRGNADTSRVARIVEEADADEEEREINEINSGIYLFDMSVFEHLEDAARELGASKVKGEYYLPDVVQFAPTLAVRADDFVTISGVNDRAQLAEAEAVLLSRLRQHWMREGVTFRMPETVYIHHDVELSPDVEVGPHCVLTRGTRIGSGTVLIQGCYLESCSIGEDCTLLHVRGTEAELLSGVRAGPYVNLRPGTILREDVKVGNFVETKKADVGARSKLPHLQYIGDATLGEDVNIGAGTIFCNYDGFEKHHTTLGNKVFIGSNSSLSAPLTIGDGAYVAMASAIVSDVPAGALAIARARQENKLNYVAKLKEKLRQRAEQAQGGMVAQAPPPVATGDGARATNAEEGDRK